MRFSFLVEAVYASLQSCTEMIAECLIETLKQNNYVKTNLYVDYGFCNHNF